MAAVSPVETRFSVVLRVKFYSGESTGYVQRSATFSFRNAHYYFELNPLSDGSYETVLHPAVHCKSFCEPFDGVVGREREESEKSVLRTDVLRSTITSIPHIIGKIRPNDVLNYITECYTDCFGARYYQAKIVFTFPAGTPTDVRRDEGTNTSTLSNDSDFPPNLESLSLDLSNLLKNETLPDVKLRCGQRVVPAHRSVLAARSEVFSAMFSHELSESQTGTVDVKDVEDEVFELFLQYVYSGKITDVPDDVVPRLYAAADKYAVDALKSSCRERMLSKLTAQNCVSVLTVADAHSDADFKKVVISFMCNHESVFKSDVWLEFCKEPSNLAMEVYQCFADCKIKKT